MSVPTVTLMIPIIRKEVISPKPIQKLIFQLNYRGFYTGEIKYGEKIEIELESYDNLMRFIRLWRTTPHRQVKELYQFLVENIEFKSTLKDPRASRSDGELLNVVLILPKNKAQQFTDLFYKAHIKK